MPMLLGPSGKLATKNGKIAIIGPGGTDCCCEVHCCGCEWLDDYVSDAAAHGCVSGKGRLKATISGAGLGGYVILGPKLGGPEGFDCLYWSHLEECGDFGLENLTNDCGWVIDIVALRCLRGNTTLEQFEFHFQSAISGCAFANPVFIEGECGPPLSLHFRTSVVQDPVSPCAPVCEGDIDIWIESIDPWPLP